MAVLYKLKHTRQSVTDEWPLTHFYDLCLSDFMEDTERQHAVAIPSSGFFWWPKTEGFVSYSYEEYNAETDVIANEHISNGTNTLDLVNENNKLVYNPTALTLTSLVTFDSLENLTLFVDRTNLWWEESISKADIQAYLTSKGMTLQEEVYIDGVLTNTGLSCFN